MTCPLPQAPANCVPSDVHAILRILPVDGFSRLQDHCVFGGGGGGEEGEGVTEGEGVIERMVSRVETDWRRKAYSFLVTESQCVECSHSKQFTCANVCCDVHVIYMCHACGVHVICM